MDLKGSYPYVYLDGIYLKKNWGRQAENVSVLAVLAVERDGYMEMIDTSEGLKEDSEIWLNLLRCLKQRGLMGIRLFVGD